ncbi:FUSC family protein [Pusillimonas sp. CC-YST705]|uniref:FUSC family protein n=1 Tax=Mesopusillimonas faecipullorum TaxID=2755040 RepID=A0ABS8C8I8_9BURK|nr:FUSC family protein [Mesopusillimonas faecipullorum]MCB5362348.1 FUSC family protein [Mesopusillimonas faecipullorum]
MSHPAWAAMGAVAVLQASQLHINMHRAVQRMAGTVLGAALAWVLLVQNPSIWSIVTVLVALQFLTEIVIGINYALGQVLITPMALLMTYLAVPTAAGMAMVAERVVDTVLGAIVGMLIAVLLSRMKERRTLALHHGSRAR